MQIIAIANQKGGVGKTSMVVNLAAAFARREQRTLLVDMDPQGSLTEYFVNPTELEITIYDALLYGFKVPPCVLGEYIRLIPATIDLAKAEIVLPSKRNQEHTLNRFLRQYATVYDYCLIDCPPSLGVMTANALTAAHWVIVPVSTELMAERTVRLILETVDDIRESELNPDLKVWHIVPTMYDQRLAHHREILEALRVKYEDWLYPDPVRAIPSRLSSTNGPEYNAKALSTGEPRSYPVVSSSSSSSSSSKSSSRSTSILLAALSIRS